MDSYVVKKIINSLSVNHPLRDDAKPEYRTALEKSITKLDCIKEDKLRTLLCGDCDYNKFVYNQGVVELMLYFYLSSSNITFTPEKRINPDNDKNVDVSAEYKGVTYNFEVKSPVYNETNDGMIHGRIANRFGIKEENDKTMDALAAQIREAANHCGVRGVVIDKITDDKVKDCILSSQSKFNDPTKTNCNILLISTTTAEMIEYWDYITNGNSGFFNPFSDVSLFNNKGEVLSRDKYDKLTAIILSNAITVNEKRDSTAWDMSNALSIVLTNPFCKGQNKYGLQLLSEFFTHRTCEYAQGLIDFNKTHNDFPERCYMSEFVANYGYSLNPENRRNQE